MGSIHRLHKERMKNPHTEQDTLLSCPACSGNGFKVMVESSTSYSKIMCRWCSGTGGVVRHAYLAFKRIERIYKLNSKKNTKI